MDQDRSEGIVVDLERLESQASELYLHRFVEAIRKARGDHGRFLILRAGDELAIRAAGDGSDESLGDVTVGPMPSSSADELPSPGRRRTDPRRTQ